MTVLDVFKRSMRLLGAIAIGDNPTADEAADCLLALNGMVDAWATEKLMLFQLVRTLYNLTSGKQVYSIGPAAVAPDWTGPRPEFIERAGLMLLNSDPSQVLEVAMKVLRTDKEWARIRAKTQTSDLPRELFYDHGLSAAGAGQVALWPIPTASNQIALYTRASIAEFTALTQIVSLPPGYRRALIYNLALEIAPEFDVQPSAIVIAVAQESKFLVKRGNFSLNILRPDLGGGGGWDWQTGEVRS